jgi:putative spermidine/putrescine transport system substrate-binding protein
MQSTLPHRLGRRMTPRHAVVVAALLASVSVACTGGSNDSDDRERSIPRGCPGGSALPTKVCEGEGLLRLIAWEGYVEDGSSDAAYDWVTPFEQETGCRVEVTYARSAEQMQVLLAQGDGGRFDGVSASGVIGNQLIQLGLVAPINVDLVPGFALLSAPLRSAAFNTVDGAHYGISFLWGVNLLAFDEATVRPAPKSWKVLFDPDSRYAGKLAVYDSPITIADAALYLRSERPELGIQDPFGLTADQLNAAVALLAATHRNVGAYWSDFATEIGLFAAGRVVAGMAWPYQVNRLREDGHSVRGVIPREGVTGWADAWMMDSRAPHPNCMYRWLQWSATPEVQAQAAEWFGAAPANPAACDELPAEFCRTHFADDAGLIDRVAFWRTPQARCGDGRDDCTDYSAWIRKWGEIRSG